MRHKPNTSPRRYLVLTVCLLGAISPLEARAQAKVTGEGKSPLCTRYNALEMVKEQIGLTKTFNNSSQRITVLVRAADLLWPYDEKKARGVFMDAYGLAIDNEKENDEKAPPIMVLRLPTPDERYAVIRAVAKRDSALAKELTRVTLSSDSDASRTRTSFYNVLTAERLLDSANQLLATDINAALDLAKASLNYPASSALTRFLYKYAELNQQGADQFYAQALAIYGDRPMREFLYLQAYPFALTTSLDTPIFAFYVIPLKFMTSQSLQRQFVQTLLRRARQAIEAPADQTDIYRNSRGDRLPGTVHLLHGLMQLEPQIATALPDLAAPVTEAREKILVSLSADDQKLFLEPGREASIAPKQTFDEQIESALKTPDLNERDDFITRAVFGAEKESLENVLRATDEITESSVRAHLLEWLYFHRALVAVEARQFEEAERLAAKVEGNEQRAYLHIEIAKPLLNRTETQPHGRELLDEAVTEARKAGTTIFAARSLLTAASLYAKIELSRSISVLADAIKCINRLEAPDFSGDGQYQEKRIDRKGRGGEYKGDYLFHFYMPGLDPEAALREIAKVDFDASLAQNTALTDKFQRGMSSLGLADACLQQLQSQTKRKKTTKP